MQKIWISRVSPWDFAYAGIMRYSLWFEKPTYQPAMFECPMFGPLESDSFRYGNWCGESGVPLKVFSKQHPAFVKRVFKDSLACYVPIPEDVVNPYSYLLGLYDEKKSALCNGAKVGNPDNVEAFAKHTAYLHSLTEQAEGAIELPGKGWREHLLEYDLDMQFILGGSHG